MTGSCEYRNEASGTIKVVWGGDEGVTYIGYCSDSKKLQRISYLNMSNGIFFSVKDTFLRGGIAVFQIKYII
jgi:hypothetical protein